MSTSYYYIEEPFTSIRLLEGPVHDRVSLWESHGLAGTLTVSHGKGRSLVRRFIQYADDPQAPLRTHWGGKEVGCVVTENIRGLADDLVLIDEYGEPVTVGVIRARAGHVRKDGMPGELFGYDPRVSTPTDVEPTMPAKAADSQGKNAK